MKKEIWKTIIGFDNYQISNHGRVKSIEKLIIKGRNGRIKKLMPERILKLFFDSRNMYQVVGLWNNGKMRSHRVHRLVAEAFIPNPKKKDTVNHKDGDKTNNYYWNLEWMTMSENIKHSFISLKRKKPIGRPGVFNKCNKITLQYSLDGKFIKEWPSAKEVQRQLGFFASNINSCCLGLNKSSRGFIWKYK